MSQDFEVKSIIHKSVSLSFMAIIVRLFNLLKTSKIVANFEFLCGVNAGIPACQRHTFCPLFCITQFLGDHIIDTEDQRMLNPIILPLSAAKAGRNHSNE
jgi:hypothetical protein